MKKISLFILCLIVMPFALLFTGCNENTKYNINFIVDEQIYTKIETNGNEYIQLPNEPEKDGYIFVGWFFDEGIWQNEFKSSTYAKKSLDSNVNVFAHFSYIEEQIPIDSIILNKTSLNLQTNETYSLIATILPSNATYKKISWSSSNLSVATVTNGIVKAVGIGQTIITAKTNNNLTATCIVNVVDASQNVQVEVYIDGQLNDTLTTNFQNDYKINIPTKPEDITTNPNSEKYFYGWFVDSNYQTPLTEDTTFMQNSKIYGKWITIYSNNFMYTVSKGKATITLFNNIQGSTVVVVPCYINSFPVETIGASAFINQTMLRNVIICNGIKVIEERAFYGCNSMVNIELPNTLEHIKQNAFENCELLTKIDLPHSLQTIEVSAFKNCSELKHVNFNNNGWWVANDSNYVFEKNIDTLNSSFNAQNLTVNHVNQIWSNYKLFSITYHLNNGYLPDDAPYYFSEYTTVNLVDAIKNGYTFEGFYINSSYTSQKIEDIDKRNIDLDVWAKWSINTYRIKYNLEGGSLLGSNPTTYNIEMSDFQLLSPIKEYYDFNGWYDGNNLVKVVETQLCKDMTLIAKFTPTVYTIKYELNGGINDRTNPTTYTIESPTITLQSAKFANETVSRWYGENDFKTRITTIPQGSHGNIKLYARAGYDGYDICNISNNNEVTGINTSFIKEFNIELKSLVIPNDVVGIFQGAFKGCSSLESVTIPNNVTSIGYSAFEDCSSLKEMTLPFVGGSETENTYLGYLFRADGYSKNSNYVPTSLKKVTITNSIGDHAFQNCSSLTNVTIGNNVISIGYSAFRGCGGLTSVTIGNSVTSIGDSAFKYCSRLTSITIGNSVTSIGNYAFEDCSSLTSVTIGNNVTSIGDYAFNGCSRLTSITIPNSVTSIGEVAFYGCYKLVEVYNLSSLNIKKDSSDYGYIGYYAKDIYKSLDVQSKLKTINGVIYYIDRTEKIAVGLEDINATSIVIDNNCTEINQGAFYKCSNLTSVFIPNSVTSIGDSAFEDCSSLKEMTLPFVGKSETENTYLGYLFGADGYSNNSNYVPTSLNKVTITKSIGNSAFYSCSNLTSITIGNSVTSIGDDAFRYCSSLTSITIGNSVTSIGNYAFEDCSSLTSVSIGNSVTSIGSYAFYNCSSLTNVYYTGTIENWCNITFSYYNSNPMSYASHFYIKNSNGEYEELTETEIPSTITEINDYVFYRFKNVTKVTIPDSVTSIGERAFSDCSSLKYNIYDNAKYLGNNENPYLVLVEAINKDITTCTININTRFIHSDAFKDCRSLTSINIPNGVTSIGDRAFMGCNSLTSINIPNSVTSIGDYAFFYCSSLTSINIPNGVTSIGDRAFMGCNSLTSINIPNSVTSIGDSAFWNCSSLTIITIPNSVTSIGDLAFTGCSGLTSITIPNSVTNIGRGVFSTCRSLEYNVYDNAKYLGNNENPYLVLVEAINKDRTKCNININTRFIHSDAFKDCSSLTSINIPNGVTSIGDSAFMGCNSLTSITIPNGVTSIGDSAFKDCSSLTSITIPNGVTSIGDSAFMGCSSLTSINIPNGVTSIEDSAFMGCNSLTSITIPDSATHIGYKAFEYCSSLKNVYYKGGGSEWKTIFIGVDNNYLIKATIYYFSEEKPTTAGNYWHYVDGVVTKW